MSFRAAMKFALLTLFLVYGINMVMATVMSRFTKHVGVRTDVTTTYYNSTSSSWIECCLVCNKSSICKNAIYNKKGKKCYFSDQQYTFLIKYKDVAWDIYSALTEPWSFVFLARPGLSVDIADAWEVGGPGTTDSPTCISTFESCPGYFRHKALSDWENILVSEVRFSYWYNGAEAGFVVFNGTGSSISDWFSPSRILYSSWENVVALCPCSDFKIKGGLGRRFVIAKYVECSVDEGYSMIIQEPHNGCGFDHEHAFHFSSLSGPSVLEGADTFQADFMSIQIKSGP